MPFEFSDSTTITTSMPVFDPSRDSSRSGLMPADWANSLDATAPNVTGIVAEQRGAGESWADTLQRIMPMLVTTYQQKQILEIQLERARAGLPPLPNSEFGAQVSVGLDAQTRQYLIIGGVGLAALLAWRAFARKG